MIVVSPRLTRAKAVKVFASPAFSFMGFSLVIDVIAPNGSEGNQAIEDKKTAASARGCDYLRVSGGKIFAE